MSENERKVEELEQEVSEASAQAPAAGAVKGEPMKKVEGGTVEDLGPAVVKTTDKNPDSAKKVKPTKDDQNKGAGSESQVSQGSSKIKEPLAAGDDVSSTGEDIVEADMPKTKAGMLQAIYDKMKGMRKGDIADSYEKIMASTNVVKEDDEEDAEEAVKAKEAKEKAVEKRVKEIDVKEDVDALVDGESELSTEFKTKAATIFEAAVKSKVKAEIERLEEEYSKELKETKNQTKDELVQKVDNYLNYVVEEWVKDNELAIERGIKGEIAEDFIGGLKQLFEDHYIDVPDEKYDILEAQAQEIEELKGKVNVEVSKNVELTKSNSELTKSDIFEEVADGMADTEKEKFKGLIDDVDFEGSDGYKKKLDTIKESYFKSGTKPAETNVDTLSSDGGTVDIADRTDSMTRYTAAISRTKNTIKLNNK
jgi:hypothetical protein